MIKNGRPYTIENGYTDDALLHTESESTIGLVSEWIQKNVRKSNKILHGQTSYGLKHLLEKDTGVYLTNNQFKDAMLLAGYCPVDEHALNWNYRIQLTKESGDNPSPFYKWAVRTVVNATFAEGDFIRDMQNDHTFPIFAEHDIIQRYLEHIGACSAAMEAFESLWTAYTREA